MNNHFAISPSAELWQRWMEDNPRATRLFARVYHAGHDDEEFFLAPIGDPVHGDEHKNAIYLPTWMIDTNKYEGCGEETVVEIVDIHELPRATKITLRPVDSALHEVDVVRVFESCFSQLGVLQKGKQYLIPLEELGGFHVGVYVAELEPGPEVYLDGDEVPLEFEQPVDYVEPPVHRPPTPIPTLPSLLSADDMGTMIPDSEAAAPAAPTPQTNLRGRGGHPSGFIPFSGMGRRLDGK